MGAGDDDVDLARSLADRVADLLEPELQRHEAGGKAGRDGGDRNARAVERPDGGRDHGRIDADGGDGRRRVGEAEGGEEVVAQRAARLGAEAADALGRVVAGERGEIDAGQRLHQPGGLVFLLDRAAGGQRRGAALDRAGVDADALEPGGVERNARIARPVVALKGLVPHLVHRAPRVFPAGGRNCHDRGPGSRAAGRSPRLRVDSPV